MSYDLRECEIQSIEEGNTSFKIKIVSKTDLLPAKKPLTIFYKERAAFEVFLLLKFELDCHRHGYPQSISLDSLEAKIIKIVCQKTLEKAS